MLVECIAIGWLKHANNNQTTPKSSKNKKDA